MVLMISNSHLLTIKKTFTSCYIKNIFLYQEYENWTIKSEYEFLYKMDDELKGDKITVENEGVVEYGNDFLNCKIIHSKQ